MDWQSVRTFGEMDPTLPHVLRPSAYVIVQNPAGLIAVVRTPRGCYLPGGGCLPDEDPTVTAAREAHEEGGLSIIVGSWRCLAVEHVPVPNEGATFEKRSTFCDALLSFAIGHGSEAGHSMEWLSPNDASVALHPASHRWAVEQWCARQGTRL